MPPTDPDGPESPAEPATAPNAGGRPGVTRAQVAEQVDTFVARTGRAPTVRELRTALGGTGSLSTLSRHLSDVKGERLLAAGAPEQRSPEAAMLKTLNGIMQGLAGDAAAAAEEQIAQGAREAQQRIEAADALAKRARDEADAAQLAAEHAQGRAEVLDNELKQAHAERQRLDQSLEAERTTRQTQLQEHQSAITALNQALSESNAEVARWQDKHESLFDNLSQVQASLEKAEVALTATTGQRDQAQQSLLEQQVSIERITAQRQQAEQARDQALAEADHQRTLLDQWQARHAELEHALSQTQANVEQLHRERAERTERTDQLSEMQSTLAELQRQLANPADKR